MEQPGNLLLSGGQVKATITEHDDTSRITDVELRQIAARNATQQPFTEWATVPQLVATQARATPHALAVAMGEQTLTYEELNARANQLAHYMQSRGVGNEALVAVCLERSVDLVVTLLAIQKAGAAYLPLDHRSPRERLAYTIADARPQLLVTSEALTDLVAPGIAELRLSRDAAELRQQSADDPVSDVSPDHLAYVIYTSGSTGQPKGVEVTHQSLLNLVRWHQRAFTTVPNDRATQLASPAFDATVWELWPYLTAGASVHLADDLTRQDAQALLGWLVANAITVTFLPTPLAEQALGLDWPSTCALRLLLTGADTLHIYPPPTLPFALINNYGPTEATVVATSTHIAPARNPAGPPPIGRPIDNVQVFLLDDALRQVPIGTPGELYIGGAGVARGYRNRPELTAERFIPHPFETAPTARLYRTGDIARYLPDGQIAFLGRADEQVKVRGYRIEPAEVVAALNRDPSVQTSCVVARRGDDGQAQLVAYVVPQPGVRLTRGDLCRGLMTYLPAYMIPSVFMRLDAVPMTPNGKVDRDALLALDATNEVPDDPDTAATSGLQEHVSEIVASTLGLRASQIGLDDNFFLLGGHSMLGTQVIALVSRAFGVDVSLRTLFDAPTVRELSARVEHLILAKIEAMSEEEAERLLG